MAGERTCDQHLADFDRALEISAEDPGSSAGVAVIASVWFAGRCPDQYDGQRYEKLARRAVEYDTSNAVHHYYYSSVLWRNGKVDDALREMEAAIALDAPELGQFPYPWLLLAQVHWELGNPAEARRSYDRAVDIIETYAPRQAGWNLRRDEVAAVLGIER